MSRRESLSIRYYHTYAPRIDDSEYFIGRVGVSANKGEGLAFFSL